MLFLSTNAGQTGSSGGSGSESQTDQNLGLSATVAANALTIALKQADGTSDPTTAGPVYISFRNSTATSGGYNLRSVAGALSLVVSSGSTLGTANGSAQYIYVYALDNSGTVELAISTALFDEGTVASTTAEGGAGAADSGSVLYSTTARSNVPIRLIGRLLSTQSTAGTWASAMTQVCVIPFSIPEIGARYTLAAAQALPNNVYTQLVWDTKVYDTNNGMSTGNGAYQVMVPGKYYVNAKIATAAIAGWGAAEQVVLACHRGTTLMGYLFEHAMEAAHTGYVSFGGCMTLNLANTDNINLRLYQNNGATVSLNTDVNSNYVDIVWLGF